MLNCKNFYLFLLLSLFHPLLAAEEPLEKVYLKQQERLEDANKRLIQLRQNIHEQQIPLNQALESLKKEVDSVENELDKSRSLRDTASLSLEQLSNKVEKQNQEIDYITNNLFTEFESSFNAALSAGELPTFGESLSKHNLFLEDAKNSEKDKLNSSLQNIQTALERIDGLLGGKKFQGKAINPQGSLQDGIFIQVGPLLYFTSETEGATGWVEETQSLQPKVFALQKGQTDKLAVFLSSDEGELPIDPTLGDVIAIEKTKETVAEHLQKGGIWVIPIMCFAALSMIIAIYKFLQIFSIRHPNPLVVHEIVKLIRHGDNDGAHELANSQPGPSGLMLKEGVANAKESTELVEEVMFESILSVQPKLERFLNIIAVTAATAPLLGLLGTVTGIIKTFKLMEVFGAGDPKPLISGISEALITTELGLVLAIPALVAHALLSRKVSGILAQMEKLSVAFLNGLSRRNASLDPTIKS